MSYFSRGTFTFLKELAENNEREWFQENRHRYDAYIKEPAQRFIVDVGPRLDEISPHLRADPRPVGGSLFRIHRDVRFSKDKSPYKTATGIQFRHAQGKDAHAPGLYLHIEPKGCFVGVGTWHPAGPALKAIRESIAEDTGSWRAALEAPGFLDRFELSGDRLKRPPRGFDPEHPAVDDLKWKDFVGFAAVPQSFVTGDSLVDDLLEMSALAVPYMRFLCRALGVPF